MSDKIIKGSVWKYGDNINTDIISPPAYMELSIAEASKYAMSPIDPEFSTKFNKGDILVAENNFGSGSSRETAPLTLKHLGVDIIIAKSFARIFYRNAINLGILVLECNETHKIEDRDELEVNYLEGEIKNITKNETYKCSKMPEHIMKIINAGGLVPFLKEYKKDR
ncbi:MAG: 3-isopropylmalate/(R)-2-methylmalate dehydratase small subunit [Candidatus Petromonas sp.]|jgi:3-isopropylmalate/(R)-2-methylmalate dehydratase small subunit|nr:3-isopropylmalate/(R)-2-methylmalate dehydratase small subunit [Candidatus Petromonas sp.]